MGAQSTPILTKTRRAADAITRRRFLGFDDQQAAVAGEAVLGVARSDVANGEHLSVDMLGTTIVETGAAVTVGYVMTDAQGRAVPFTAAVGTHIAGIALEPASGVGEFVEILVLHGTPK